MSNASFVWAQLATPNPAAGSLPFVASDNATIITDVLNFYYDAALEQLGIKNGLQLGYTDKTGTPGAAIINTVTGRVKIAAAGTTLVVTDNQVLATSIVQLQLETIDATMTRVVPTAIGNGTFTITGNAAATGAVTVSFVVVNLLAGVS